MSPPLPSIGAPPLPVASSRIPPSSGRREGDSFDPASRRAPPSLLLFASSGRRDGDSFDRASRRAPPLLLLFASSGRRKGDSFDRGARGGEGWYCQARGGDEQGVVRAARRRLVRSRVVARSHRSCCSRCPGGLFDRASRRAPPHAFGRLLGEGAQGERGGMSGFLEGGGWGDEGATEMGFLSMRGACEYARVWGKKKPKAKFARCSGIGKLCPHATASPKSPRKNAEAADNCAIGAEWGGGGNEQNGQESAPPEVSLAQNRFLVFGLRFRKRGKPQEGLRKKKKKRQTARPRF